jgi:alpha-amylase
VFTNNHDTQRSHGLFYQDAVLSDLSTVFLLTHPYGYPKVMSSYAFDRGTDLGRALGPPSDADGATRSVYGDGAEPNCAPTQSAEVTDAWICEHRRAGIFRLLAFRKATAGAPVTHTFDDGQNQLAFGRDGRGFVAINGGAEAFEAELSTGLEPGTYCDLLTGGDDGQACAGMSVVVDADGNWTASLPGLSAVVLQAPLGE